MYRKVLLAYDGSEDGRLALREGARLARLCGAEVFLLAVVPQTTGMTLVQDAAPELTIGQDQVFEDVLAEGVRRLERMGFPSPLARITTGDPARQIEAKAREIGADLVVVGHRRHGVLTRFWPGSVASYLMEHLGCSVLVGRMQIADEDVFGAVQNGATAPPPPA